MSLRIKQRLEIFCKISMIVFFGTSLTTVSHAALVGSIAGDLSIQEGASRYSIPITVPPGVAGLQPSLSFNYRSGRSANIMGEGWSLGGLSTIQRCAASKIDDGFDGNINFNDQDRFCLNGSKLVAVSGTYGANGTEYRTVIDRFSRIISYGSAVSGPSSFKVWTKSGKVMEYGNTNDSRILAQGRAQTLTWALNKTLDSSNNAIGFSYNNIANHSDFSIREINYAGDVKVSFSYQDISSSAVLSWLSNSKLLNSQQLDTVITSVAGQEVNTWQLNYTKNAGTEVTLLQSVQLCAQGECLPTTDFTWQTHGASGLAASSRWISDFGYSTGGWHGGQHPRKLSDVNGDGKPDIVAFNNSAVEVSLSTGTGFAGRSSWLANKFGQTQGWRVDSHLRSLADVNGDGLDDIVGFANDGVYVATSTGSSFTGGERWLANFGASQGWNKEKNPCQVIDVNNDGRADIVGFANDGIYVALSTGSGFAPKERWAADFYTNNTNWHKRSISDVNGDGFVDIVGFYLDTIYVALGNGSSFLAKTAWSTEFTQTNGGWNKDNHPRKLIDINHDGLADVVGFSNSGVHVALSTGTRFSPSTQWVSGYGYSAGWRIGQHYRELKDVNGDGISDVVGINNSGVQVSYGDGKSFTTAQSLTSSFGGASTNWYLRTLGDVNADGLLDVIGFNANGVDVATMDKSVVADRGRSLIHTVTNGLGAKNRIEYGQMSDISLYTKGNSASYPERNVIRTSSLVKQVYSDNGIGGEFSSSYRYGGAITELENRGYQGFKWIEKTSQTTGLVTRNQYLQSYPYTGRLETQLITLSDGQTVSELTNSYTQKSLNSGLTLFPYLQTSQTKKYEIDASLISTTTINNSLYDAYGNLGKRENTVTGGAKSFSQIDTYSYQQVIDSQHWYINLITHHAQQNSRPNTPSITNNVAYSYFPNSNLVQQQIKQPNSPLALTANYTKDNYGNVTNVSLTGRNTKIVSVNPIQSVNVTETRASATDYDSSGRFPALVNNALSQSQNTVYDNKYGNLIEQKDINGHFTFWQYDVLGRNKLETRRDNTTTTTQRHWQNNCADAPSNSVYCLTTKNSGDTPVTHYYDLLGRNVRKASIGFDGRKVFIDNHYNQKGQLAKTSRAYYVGERTYWAEFSYDALGRQITSSQPGPNGHSAINRIQYQGLSLIVTDAKGNQKTTTNNALVQIEHLQEPLGASINYTYDANGNLTKTVDDQGNTISISYDDLGNKIAMNDPDKGQWQYSYNAFGELVSQTDAKNKTTYLSYDLLGRLQQRLEPASHSSAVAGDYDTNTWQYDIAINGKGMLAIESGPTTTVKATLMTR